MIQTELRSLGFRRVALPDTLSPLEEWWECEDCYWSMMRRLEIPIAADEALMALLRMGTRHREAHLDRTGPLVDAEADQLS